MALPWDCPGAAGLAGPGVEARAALAGSAARERPLAGLPAGLGASPALAAGRRNRGRTGELPRRGAHLELPQRAPAFRRRAPRSSRQRVEIDASDRCDPTCGPQFCWGSRMAFQRMRASRGANGHAPPPRPACTTCSCRSSLPVLHSLKLINRCSPSHRLYSPSMSPSSAASAALAAFTAPRSVTPRLQPPEPKDMQGRRLSMALGTLRLNVPCTSVQPAGGDGWGHGSELLSTRVRPPTTRPPRPAGRAPEVYLSRAPP